MKIIDLHDPQRIDKSPDGIEILMTHGTFVQDEFVISKVEDIANHAVLPVMTFKM